MHLSSCWRTLSAFQAHGVTTAWLCTGLCLLLNRGQIVGSFQEPEPPPGNGTLTRGSLASPSP